MFLNNQHTKEYYKIIKKNLNLTKGLSVRKIKKQFAYTEKHHIIPKSMNGLDKKDNIVYMSAADHFKCHQLLINMTEGKSHGKMWNSLWRMMNKQSKNQLRNYEFTPEEYELARIKHAATHSTNMLGKNNPFYNQKHSKNSIEKMSLAKKGKSYEEIFGEEYAKEMREKRRIEQLGRKKGKQKIIQCNYCDVKGGIGIMNRWHGKNCKNKPVTIQM
jgi:hypothetical protein